MSFDVRIINIDHYTPSPGPLDRTHSPFCTEKLSKVPVLRIFGSTQSGQKACLHIHQVYPYFFVPYTIPVNHTAESIQKDIYQFGASLNQAFDLTRPHSNKNQHIAAIVLVKGIPFYGYHDQYQTFLKIYLTDPSEKQQMVDLLQSQAMMGQHFQPFESHLSYELQFMIDHNLLDWVHLDIGMGQRFGLGFRSSEEQYKIQTNTIPRESYCELELDVPGLCISNRWELKNKEMPDTLFESVMTVFQSVEALYPSEYHVLGSSFLSDQFVLSADPLHYKTWEVEQSQVDLSLMDSYLEEKLAIESQWDEKSEQENMEDDLETDDLEMDDIVRCLIDAERHEPTNYPTVSVEYEETAYEPLANKLQKVDALSMNKERREIHDGSQTKENLPFQISDIPPDVMSGPNRYLKRFRINQLDGSKGVHSLVKNETSEEAKARWDREIEILKRMRRTRKRPVEFDTDVAVVIKKSPLFGRKKQDFLNKSKVKKEALTQEKSKNGNTNTTSDRTLDSTRNEWKQRKKNAEAALLELTSLTSKNHSGGKKTTHSKRSVPQDKGTRKSFVKVGDLETKARWDREIEKIRQIKRKMRQQYQKRAEKSNASIDSASEDAEKHISQSKENTGLSLGTLSSSANPILDIPTNKSKVPEPNLEFDWEAYRSLCEKASSSKTVVPMKKPVEFVYKPAPPILSDNDPVLISKSRVTYKEPFYSKPSDVPRYPTVFNGKEFKLKSNDINSTREFKTAFSERIQREGETWENVTIREWMPAELPPSFCEVKEWFKNKEKRDNHKKVISTATQLDGPSLNGTFDFKYTPTKPISKITRIDDHLCFFSLEIHVNTRHDLLPDPERDSVQIIFYCLQTSNPSITTNGYEQGYHVGVIALSSLKITKIGISTDCTDIDYGVSEEELFFILINKIRLYDPDMLVGYEVQNASWGYLIERASCLGINLVDALSRINSNPSDTICRDQWGYKKASAYKICGRHMLNVWRLMRSEFALTSYTFENMAYHLLHYRIPHFSHSTLTKWYEKGPAVLKHRLFKHYMRKVQINLEILDASQVVSRTCESARVYGVDFYSVITRGSQFKVEAVMFRMAKLENFLMISPSRKQVAEQRSLECLPLVMEPESKYYSSPMAVLDFRSLYPSIMIAYNYCYSTCLGRIRRQESSRFGVLESFDLPDGLLESLEERINISPNGIMFVKPEVRQGLLGRMLQELLDSRVKVKESIKDYKDDSGMLRYLDAKQLSLKFIANVTYGYTSASFSGRMPSVEIADSIVQTARETLEKTIDCINNTEKWGAQVVYGDTDSVFVYFPGKTREEAFILSKEISDTITNMCSNPIQLKFEKIYHPAVLLAKKRYTGFKYENHNDKKPVYEAKGIETVRRDFTPATQKILESSLKILFRTQDMSELKEYLHAQWEKILSNRVSLKDFIIAKEVRMGAYSSCGGPNGARIAQEIMNKDARAEPQYGERVPYVVVYKGPGVNLKDRVVTIESALNDSTLRLDVEYYIRKQIIAPISRIFNLIGVDVMAWYDDMPRTQKKTYMRQGSYYNKIDTKKATRIDQYYARSHCIVCDMLTDKALCDRCASEPHKAIYTLTLRQTQSQNKLNNLLETCQDCCGISALDAMTVEKEARHPDIPCDSFDCPVFFERLKARKDVHATSVYDEIINETF